MTAPLAAATEAAQLSPVFDHDKLAAELAAVTAHTWNPQRIHTYGGKVGQAAAIDWRVLPLRSLGGDPERTDPGGPGPQTFAATHWLDQLPYLGQILDSLPAPLNAARLMALGPGAVSNPHSDPKYRLDRGIVRLHLPVITDPGAVLVLDGVEHCWQPGTFWYGDFSPRAPGTQHQHRGDPGPRRHRRPAPHPHYPRRDAGPIALARQPPVHAGSQPVPRHRGGQVPDKHDAGST
ncbi:aspartyl/asparaginyl beta-hydroxylase domain-containing protein [Streptomyces sp. NPDC048491]|uniref:aspartyl/asparaginyl beta-hydroxylase domain-containing protein n=1 Tax=Streptomyces sp. NPDC048491 TaxID=3157207 RepID=UPI003416CBC5